MRTRVACFALFSVFGFAEAQQPQQATPVQPMKTFASSDAVQAMIASAKADRKDNQPMISKRIIGLTPYILSLEYRPGLAPASVHPTSARDVYVIEGVATFVSGGTLVDGKVGGGTRLEVAKGDCFMIPENVPHWFSVIRETLVLMTLKAPRPVAAVPGR
jgi:mannose-6-phosphate isomerase-like protein (cupin superfamily)